MHVSVIAQPTLLFDLDIATRARAEQTVFNGNRMITIHCSGGPSIAGQGLLSLGDNPSAFPFSVVVNVSSVSHDVNGGDRGCWTHLCCKGDPRCAQLSLN